MDWCINSTFDKANHNPAAVLNNDKSKDIVDITAKTGSEVTLSADGSADPDQNQIDINWMFYKEAGTYEGENKTEVQQMVK